MGGSSEDVARKMMSMAGHPCPDAVSDGDVRPLADFIQRIVHRQSRSLVETAQALVDDYRKDLAEALRLLREVEWAGCGYGPITVYLCEFCGGARDPEGVDYSGGGNLGHSKDCELGAFLARHGGDDE